MTDPRASSEEQVSSVKRALIEIRDLRARLARAEAEKSAPIAIVGMGLRFPGGVTDAESFARLLWSGTDAVGPIPADRWSLDALYAQDPDAPGKMITRPWMRAGSSRRIRLHSATWPSYSSPWLPETNSAVGPSPLRTTTIGIGINP